MKINEWLTRTTGTRNILKEYRQDYGNEIVDPEVGEKDYLIARDYENRTGDFADYDDYEEVADYADEDFPDYEDEVECQWCHEWYPESEIRYEVDLGPLCHYCEEAIKSRGEELTFRENLEEDANQVQNKQQNSQNLQQNGQNGQQINQQAQNQAQNGQAAGQNKQQNGQNKQQTDNTATNGQSQGENNMISESADENDMISKIDPAIIKEAKKMMEEFEDEVECTNCFELVDKSCCVRNKDGEYVCHDCVEEMREKLGEAFEDEFPDEDTYEVKGYAEKTDDDVEADIDFLLQDEDEAIEGYNDVINSLSGHEHLKQQLGHIRDEEIAHSDFLAAAKDDFDADYEDFEHE